MDGAKAMLLVGPRQFVPTVLPVSDIESGAWLAVEATGVSGVEVQAWSGSSRFVEYPVVPGHEVVGRIAKVSDESTSLEVGTRVVVESTIRCGACRRCTSGMSSCSYRRPVNAYGQIPSTVQPALWGGFAEMMYLDPGSRVHVVSDDIPAERATVAHALAAGFTWAVEYPVLQPGETVLILGPGPRGLAAAVAAKNAGAGWVGVSGLAHDADRLRLAAQLGADMTVNAEVMDVGSAVADSLGSRPDVVVDCTSDDAEAFLTALDLVRAGGRVVLASTKGSNAVSQLFSDVVVVKELTIRGAFGASSGGYHWATQQLAVDPDLDALVSHQFPLSEADRAIQATAGMLGRDELISVAVTF